MMPLIFIGATTLVIMGMLSVLKRKGISSETTPFPAAANSGTKQPSDGGKSSTSGQSALNLVTGARSNTNENSQPPPVQETTRPSAGSEALAILETFLKASSLAERIPLIETKTPEKDLTNSILASPLPSFRNLLIDSQESFTMENIIDYYFTFEFIDKNGLADPQTVVVRRRGGGVTPRVLADPFLDLYGGRLAAYASKPQPKGELFHVIAYPLPSCNDLRIPDRQKKLTLRLYSHELSQNVTLAYASRVSKIGEILTSGNYDLTYGKPKSCVVLLGWNTKESPDIPYLEALDISALHWNP